MTDQQINDKFMAAWEEFGDDKSTEFLITVTAERCSVTYKRVVEALSAIHSKSARP